jgi:hypothetical protein
MLFNTTIIYQEGYLPTPRSRKLRFRDKKEMVYTEIKEISASEAPVAFKCDSFEYRLYNDKIYVVTPNSANMCNMEEATAIERLAFVFENCSTFYGFNENDSKEQMVSKANKYAEQYLIIDGVVWEQTGEPRYVILTFGLGNNHGGTSLHISTRYNCNLSNKAYFNINDREKAIEKALETANKRGDTNYIDRIKDCCEIQVLTPEAVKCNPLIDHVS